jgi:triosephosphate isomerase
MKYIVANWKMNLGVRESVALARGVLRHIRGKDILPQIILAPAMTSLSEVHKSLVRSRVYLAAQNSGLEYRSGAFTGEVSPAMLEDVQCKYALVGHSERRHILLEDDAIVRRRIKALSQSRVKPILCVGELLVEFESGQTLTLIEEQLEAALKHIDFEIGNIPIIAYEPVWSIGTGKVPEIAHIIEVHAHIRDIVAGLLGVDLADIVVLYGGSVDEQNAHSLLRESEIDGVLVGGASLRIHSFSDIIDIASDIIKAQN